MDKICAGIILYNPKIDLLQKNVDSLYNQVDKIILYDNSSNNSSKIKEVFKSYKNIIYIYSSQNLGMAHALNFLMKNASEMGFSWCLTMDQDSICAGNLISEYKKHINDPKVALLCPFILNNNKFTLKQYKNLKLNSTEIVHDPVSCITSGCLTNISIYNKVNGLNEKLFIDFVDTELSCKVLQAGYEILRVNDTYLIQQQGVAHKIPIFTWLYKKTKIDIFRRLMVATVYTDHRLYFSSRNSRYLRKKYKNHGMRTSFLFMFAFYCYFTIFYPKDRSRRKMWGNIIKGFYDYKYIK